MDVQVVAAKLTLLKTTYMIGYFTKYYLKAMILCTISQR